MAGVDSGGDEMVIDGSILEGGGQILRITISLSAILSKRVKICKIRGGRKDAGLKPQHLTGLQLVDAMCGGRGLENAVKGSTCISMHPDRIRGGQYVGDTRTAGSISLLAQVAVPVALFADRPSRLVLRGGTDVDWAPPVDFLTDVFAPFAKLFGISMDISLIRRGFFPKGGGEVHIEVQPLHQLKPVELGPCGRILSVRGRVYSVNHHPRDGATIQRAAIAALRRYLAADVPINIEIVQEQAPPQVRGCGIILLADTESGYPISGTSYSKRGHTPEIIGDEAANAVIAEHRNGGCVVEHLSDQMIIFMALANGRSVIRTGPLTLHTQTAMHICKEILGVNFDVEVIQDAGKDIVSHEISCTGIGFTNRNKPK